MPEIKPESNINNESPEELRRQFSDALEKRAKETQAQRAEKGQNFEPEYAREEMADSTAKILNFPPKAAEAKTEKIETGMGDKFDEELKADPKGLFSKIINNPSLAHPKAQVEALKKAQRDRAA